MNRPPTRPVVPVMTLLVGAMGLACARCSGEADPFASVTNRSDEYMETIPLAPGSVPPRFVFPDDAKSDNPSLNAFIEEFGRICTQGEYDKYRMRVRRRSDPVSKEDFEQVWHNVREIRIRTVVALPGTDETPAPRYAVFANVNVDRSGEGTDKLVPMQVLKERGKWVIDALPSQELDLFLAASSQPTSAPTTTQATSRTP